MHFGHGNIIRFDNRPFPTVDEMDKALIDNWNSVVEPGDTTFILGDFCWQKEARWIEILDQLKGNKQLILGNHDIKNMSSKLRSKFQDVKDYKEITDDGRHVIMSHYPLLLYKGAYNPYCYMLCGHVHITRENNFLEQWTNDLKNSRINAGDSCGNIINVGAMMPWMGYYPRTLDEIVSAKGW